MAPLTTSQPSKQYWQVQKPFEFLDCNNSMNSIRSVSTMANKKKRRQTAYASCQKRLVVAATLALSAAATGPLHLEAASNTILNHRQTQQQVTLGILRFEEDPPPKKHKLPPTPAPVALPTPSPVAQPTPAPVASSTPAPVPPPTPSPVPPPTPAPVPPPTPAPVTPTLVPAVSKEATPPIDKPVSPWHDDTDQDPLINISQDTPKDEPQEQPPSPFFGQYCNNIQTQNHGQILEKQEAGEAGPSYLYSLSIFVVYDETVLTKEDVPALLDDVNVPMALSISGCAKQSRSGNRQLQTTTTNTNTPQEAEVEYAEVESWRLSTEEGLSCAANPPTEGLECSVYKTRAIVFLVDNAQASSTTRQNEFHNKTQLALEAQTDQVLQIPGILAMNVHSIDSATLASNNPTDANGIESSVASSSSSSLLSEKETLVVGSVAAGIGGLLIGMICLVRWRKSSRCANPKHMQVEVDNEDDDAETQIWSPPKSLNTSFSPSEIQADLEALQRGFDLDRVHSLLDDPEAAKQLEPNKGVTLKDRRLLQGYSTPEWYDDEDQQGQPNCEIVEPCCCPGDGRPCSSATCTACESLRCAGIDRGDFLWLKELLPEGPQRVPSFDPTRPCLTSDTVQL